MSIVPRLAVCLALGLVATSLREARADSLRVQSPKQIVSIGGALASFEADVLICESGAAEGEAEIEFDDDDTKLKLRAVHGALQFGVVPLIVWVVEDGGRDAGPPDFVVAAVEPVPSAPECELWIFTGSTVQGSPPRFDAETTIGVERGRDCEPPDFGQEPVAFQLDAEPQQVLIEPSRETAGFAAELDVTAENSAAGTIELDLGDEGTLCYDLIFGAVLLHDDSFTIKLVGVERSTGFVLRATASPPGTCPWPCPDENGLFWDLVNGSTGQEHHTFEAVSSLRLIAP